MSVLTEQDLLKSARVFDLNTLGSIYDEYSPGIYRYALRLLGDAFLAEDCVADTFSRFLKSLRANQGPQDHLQAYLYRIAHNWITDSYRRQAPLSEELNESFQDIDAPKMEILLEKNSENHRLKLALRALTPDQRQVIILRFVEEWNNAEIAEALQKPVGAIKALQHRALDALRKLLPMDEKASQNGFK